MKMLDGYAIDFMEAEDGFDAKLGICGKHFDIKNNIEDGTNMPFADISTGGGRTYLEAVENVQIDVPGQDEPLEDDTRDIIRHIIRKLIYN